MTEVRNFNHDWEYVNQFTEGFLTAGFKDKDIEKVRIPHSNCRMPLHYFEEKLYQKICGYRKEIAYEKDFEEKLIFLHFEGVAHEATVYLNEEIIGVHQGGYTGFQVELTPYLKKSEKNLLVVKVDSTEQGNIPPFGNVIDYMTFGGIYREVSLEIKEKQYIKDVFVKPMAVLSEHKKVEIQCEIANFSSDLMLIACMEDREDGKQTILFTKELKNQKVKEETFVEGITLWDVTNPKLYEFSLWLLNFRENQREVSLSESKDYSKVCQYLEQKERVSPQNNFKIVDRQVVLTGFRDAKFLSDGFYLNGKKVLLRGLNRHQSYPYVGYAMPKAPQQLDADVLKYELMVNAVRTSHYPQSKHFLNRCDEIGLLVFTEIPGWQHIGNAEWKEVACENVREMVLENRNHPSIILWGVRINESNDDDEFYQKANQIAKSLDDSRQTGGVRNIKHSHLLEDVYTYNDFLFDGKTKGIDKKRKVVGKKDVPYLVSEYNGHMFPTKNFDSEEHRTEHALRHAKVLDAIAGEKGVSGGFGWCMFDYHTHQDFGSGDKICYHGVMDCFRNPKLAAAVYAAQSEEAEVFEVSSTMDIGEHPGCFRKDTYFITNADCIKIYKNNRYLREYKSKDSTYRNLSHGPILMDDYIGNRLVEEEGYSEKKSACVKDGLNAASRYGVSHLPLKSQCNIVKAVLFHGLKLKDAVPLYEKYIGDWGGHVTSYRFDAIKDGKVFKKIIKEPVKTMHFHIKVDHVTLKEEDTYDVATVRIRVLDQNENQVPYYQGPIIFETEGVIKLIGPSTLALLGGMGGTYIKTSGKKGMGTLEIQADGLTPYEVKFEVV